MKSTGFQFKQFFIAHDKCAMKVNTDGILLGALANVTEGARVLDLGAGSGLVSLMAAQRGAASVVGLEIEPNAAAQAQQNALNSPWAARISILQQDVMDFQPLTDFDLVVSNPPYFAHSPASRSQERELARKTVHSHFSWLQQAANWLAPQGRITLILPWEAAETLIRESTELALFCDEIWHIHTKAGQAAKRAVISFSQIAQSPRIHALTIYNAQGEYSPEFKQLTQAFYLNF